MRADADMPSAVAHGTLGPPGGPRSRCFGRVPKSGVTCVCRDPVAQVDDGFSADDVSALWDVAVKGDVGSYLEEVAGQDKAKAKRAQAIAEAVQSAQRHFSSRPPSAWRKPRPGAGSVQVHKRRRKAEVGGMPRGEMI